MPTLKEILESLVKDNKITAEESASISNEVNVIRDTAVNKLKTDYESKISEASKITSEAKNNKIRGLAKDLTDESKLEAAIKLSDLTEEDTPELAVEKIKKTIEANAFLGKTPTTDPAGVKTEKKIPVAEKKETPNLTKKL
ncbi:UNVERIFIED_CONTAM: hypothetical protein RF648_17760 [Kocuria sp. CPCC 205274]|uniref:DUF4355 domain-containing protein n=1 Tax=Herbiconiux daphne TaxID=2970914 RepID=A0ABT2H8S7_9MICO|nr:hypothetical protein [Herbiconiux daphne]MCS5736365.1 hypothetical protein [Herbiconiux daphne]